MYLKLTGSRVVYTNSIFEKIYYEVNSNYVFRYDVMRNLILEMVHFAMKLQTQQNIEPPINNCFTKYYSAFFDLLERQFPLDTAQTEINLRSASDYAEHLNIQVYHLIRVFVALHFKGNYF